MNLFKILLLGIALCNLSSQRMASFRPGKDYALFFAVQEYDTWGKLRNPIKDAESIAKELKDLYGFETEIVSNPTKSQIYDKLEAYRQRKYADDAQLLIFFSGHGDYDASTQEGFFIPKDGKLNDVYQDSYLPHTRLERQINSIPCKHILLAIDACYSGTFDKAIALSRDNSNFTRPGASDANQQRQLFIDRALKYQSRLYLTSGAKERTPDPSEFARQFLAGLRNFGGDDQVLTYSELCGYMEKANPTPRFGEFEGSEPGGNFLFILKEAAPSTAPQPITRTPVQDPPRTVEKAQLDGQGSDLPGNNQPSRTVEKAEPEIHDFVFVKGGTFQMGDQFGDGDADEKPVHSVTVSDFYMGKYEVTVGDFKQFIDASRYETIAEKDGGSYIWNGSQWEKKAGINWRYDTEGKLRPANEYKHPVLHVSWYDAIEYCNWRSKQEGLQTVYTIFKTQKDPNNLHSSDNFKWTVTCNWSANGYRLPTEAEWEYAARSQGKMEKWAGTSVESELALYANYYESGSKDKYQYTAPVGNYLANALDLHDMSGNVGEWCWDWYGDKYYGESNNSRDPRGQTSDIGHVVRDGSWSNRPVGCRAAARGRVSPSYRYNSLGFRLVRH